jgi:hypothetical protein
MRISINFQVIPVEYTCLMLAGTVIKHVRPEREHACRAPEPPYR